MSELKRNLTEYGILIKCELLQQGKTQNWLIDEIKKKTDKYVDTSNLYKLMTGQIANSEISMAINEILNICTN